MTIEESIDILDDNFTVLNTHGHYTEKEEAKAIEMAIASLEAWQKVRQDIQTETDDKSNNMYFNFGMLGALAIINKHLQEVTE